MAFTFRGTVYLNYKDIPVGELLGPSWGSYAITPHNTNPITQPIRSVTVNISGVLAYKGWDGVDYVTGILPIGDYVVAATHILATGTTAGNITGWV